MADRAPSGFPLNVFLKSKNKEDRAKVKIKEYGVETFAFKKSFFIEEFSPILTKSKPKSLNKLEFKKVIHNFDCGKFSFYIQGNNDDFVVTFEDENSSINDFWRFLEEAATKDYPVIFHSFIARADVILYIEPFNKTFARFIVLNTCKLRDLVYLGKMLKYSLHQGQVNLDIIIEKEKLIEGFYDVLYNLFHDFAPIAYFEPPLTDFNFWVKDSRKLREYLKRDVEGKEGKKTKKKEGKEKLKEMKQAKQAKAKTKQREEWGEWEIFEGLGEWVEW